jgi:hypothetical protein
MRQLGVLLCVYTAGCITVSVKSYQGPDPGPAAGQIRIVKTATPAFDPYTNSGSDSIQQWMRSRFTRMLVHSPYFDQKTRWFPDSMLYIDLYAIYRTRSDAAPYVVDSHPEWILRDASGNPLYIPWGCDTTAHTCPQFAGDFSNQNFRNWWIDNARQALARGNYIGIWIDDVNMDWRVGDGDGNFVNPIDASTGLPMTVDNWRRYMADFLQAIRQALPDIEILHNSLWFAGGDQRTDNYDIRREINAADDIYIEHGVNDSGLKGGTGPWSLNALLSFVDKVNWFGRRVVIAGLGGDSPNRDSVEYAAACYFLVSNGNDFIGDKRAVTPDQPWPVLGVDLGAPKGPRYTWNGLLRRDFANGMVLVNGPESNPVTVSLPASYLRADGTPANSVTLGATRGAVLLLTN